MLFVCAFSGGALGAPFLGQLSMISTAEGFLIGTGIPFLLWILPIIMVRYEFYKDRVVVNKFFSTEEAKHEDVALAVRKGSTFELVRDGTENLSLRTVSDAEHVEELLSAHLPSPTEWLDQHEARDTPLQTLLRNYVDQRPDTASTPIVVDATTLSEIMEHQAADVTDLIDVSPWK
jgi:hypothetical protein